MSIKIDGVDFVINEMNIQENFNTISSSWGNSLRIIPSSNQTIKLICTTSNKNLAYVDKWFNGIFNGRQQYANNYKKDLIYPDFQFRGVFPVDYGFDQKGIEINFSADYFCGDFEIFRLKRQRVAKLKKLEEVCQMSS
jgi:hypothetical protein